MSLANIQAALGGAKNLSQRLTQQVSGLKSSLGKVAEANSMATDAGKVAAIAASATTGAARTKIVGHATLCATDLRRAVVHAEAASRSLDEAMGKANQLVTDLTFEMSKNQGA